MIPTWKKQISMIPAQISFLHEEKQLSMISAQIFMIPAWKNKYLWFPHKYSWFQDEPAKINDSCTNIHDSCMEDSPYLSKLEFCVFLGFVIIILLLFKYVSAYFASCFLLCFSWAFLPWFCIVFLLWYLVVSCEKLK